MFVASLVDSNVLVDVEFLNLELFEIYKVVEHVVKIDCAVKSVVKVRSHKKLKTAGQRVHPHTSFLFLYSVYSAI